MHDGHDQPSRTLAAASTQDADALSDVLRTVRLTGALFFLVDASAPWASEIPEAATYAGLVLPEAQQIVSYHIVTQGPCWASLPGGPPVRLETGDILLLPHGDGYWMASSTELRAPQSGAQARAFFRTVLEGRLGQVVTEGGGGPQHTHLICGFLGCDARPFNPLLDALPPLVHVRRASAAGDRLAPLLDFALAESRERRAGGECVLLRLSELMFVEAVRRYAGSLPGVETGWLAALRDPEVGRALALLHAHPARPWTVEGLARASGLSRSRLAERFLQLVGQPPMQYLARWRMQVATRKLADGAAKVHAVALEVGYESEAAFSRAFKRMVGAPPAEWRRRLRGRGA